jgi:hypothetical protein
MVTSRGTPASLLVKRQLTKAAQLLQVQNPIAYVGGLVDRSYPSPVENFDYGNNTLTPGAIPVEPSFSEREAGTLRFTMEPLAGASASARVQEATREMRRLANAAFGSEALRWFDSRSEQWRGAVAHPRSTYGSWFGMAVDGDGLSASKVYYELQSDQLDALPPRLRSYVTAALDATRSLIPLFTSIRCGRDRGTQRVTLLSRGPLRLTDLVPLMERLGLSHQLPGLMQIVGLALGGRFELPEMSILLGLSDTDEGPELKLEVVLGMIPDLPPAFFDLLAMALAERPRELRALEQWLQAFTPDSSDWPGRFSVMSVRVTRSRPARVSLYLRPIEFELQTNANDAAVETAGALN